MCLHGDTCDVQNAVERGQINERKGSVNEAEHQEVVTIDERRANVSAEIRKA